MANAVGLDIGGTNVRAARISRDGVILAHTIERTPPSAAATLALVDALIARMADSETAAIGVGVPGRVNATTGEVFSGGYVNLAGPPLAGRIATGGLPVFTDNDASMALVAEQRIGAGRGARNVVLLTIGTGVGGASFIDGAMVRGRGTAGQLGHLTVDVNGVPCACGRRGCLETTSSGTALRRFVADAGLPASTTVEELLARDDAQAREVLALWVGPLRFGLDTLAATLDPELVLLGGGLGAAAASALERFPSVSPWFQYRVAPAALGDSAGVIGAGLAALDLVK